MLPQSASEAYQAQQGLIAATLGLTRREWSRMGPEFDASWARIGPRIALLTAAAQFGAAKRGAASVPAILAELDESVAAMAEVDPRGFAGIAGDGRPLDSLLYGGVVKAKIATRAMPVSEALAAGGAWLDMAVHTAVADASRGAVGVAITARPKVGFVRNVNPPCCSRCAVLAGKFFKWNQGFKRHPRCDCSHIPTTLANPDSHLGTDPPLDQITDLSKADRQAIADGADKNQVFNAKRGRQDGMTTAEGVTRQGRYGGVIRAKDGSVTSRPRGLANRQRLSPAGIYRLASDRTEAIKLLKQFGYLL